MALLSTEMVGMEASGCSCSVSPFTGCYHICDLIKTCDVGDIIIIMIFFYRPGN